MMDRGIEMERERERGRETERDRETERQRERQRETEREEREREREREIERERERERKREREGGRKGRGAAGRPAIRKLIISGDGLWNRFLHLSSVDTYGRPGTAGNANLSPFTRAASSVKEVNGGRRQSVK